MGGLFQLRNGADFLQGGTLKLKWGSPRGERCIEIIIEQVFSKPHYFTREPRLAVCRDLKTRFGRGVQGGSLLYKMD